MSDDEVTREADPGWLTRLHTDTAGNGHDVTDECVSHSENGASEDDAHTIGHGDLLDQVRAAVREARGEQPTPQPPLDVTSSPGEPRPRPQPDRRSFPPPDPTSPLHSAKAAPTVTSPGSRWQPPPRLKPTTPPAAPALLATPVRRSRSRRVVLVVIAATAVALVAGVLIGRSSSSDPTPGDDTAVTTDSSTTDSSTTDSSATASSAPDISGNDGTTDAATITTEAGS